MARAGWLAISTCGLLAGAAGFRSIGAGIGAAARIHSSASRASSSGTVNERERVVLPGDFRLARGAGAAAVTAALAPFGLGLPVALPVAGLAALLASRARVVRFAFDADAFELLQERAPEQGGGGGDGQPTLAPLGDNFAVGGRNRWAYDDIVEWAMYPSPDSPVLVYFRETATAPGGQGHLFPVLTDPTRLRELMTERVGVGKLVATPPSL